MRQMVWGVVLVAMVVAIGCERAGEADPARADVARGEYLVTSVGMCGDCHSPRDQTGGFVKWRWLAGTTLEFQPIHPLPAWATFAPQIAGLPQLTDEQALALLVSGIGPANNPLRPPMPQFRFHERDARDVIAYLRTIKVTD